MRADDVRRTMTRPYAHEPRSSSGIVVCPVAGQRDSAAGQGLAHQNLKLGVDRAKLGTCQTLDGRHHTGRSPQQEGFARPARHRSPVKGAGVDDGLRLPVGAQHHQKIRHHGRLALLVQLDHTTVR